MYLLFSLSFGCLQTSACNLDMQRVASCMVSCHLADNVYRARAAGGVNYLSVLSATTSMPVLCCSCAFVFHLVVFFQIFACPIAPCFSSFGCPAKCYSVYPCAACCAMYVPRRLADNVYSTRAAGGVNYLSVMPAMISIRELWWTLFWHFFHMVVFPNTCMYILAQSVAPCMFRVALRPVCTAHGPLVE
ncbi:hypothetical protein ARMGADRAFT_444505 [Armillaria gallica]|uniref:Uncharacterized protein n=1 Tax=Armillaria gallica TaxID=47427 RepID=A0A2H3DAD1_ARMGA|nr:hypothetical protein ARMGADRAFT_444505 [Armillaria gallica]